MSSSLVTQMRLNYNLLKLQHGHIDALEEIYHLMYPSIFKYAFSVLRHYEEAEDVCQEVFLRIEGMLLSMNWEQIHGHGFIRLRKTLSLPI